MEIIGGLILAIPMIIIYFTIVLIKKGVDILIDINNKHIYIRELKRYYKDRQERQDTEYIRRFLRSIDDRQFEYFCANYWKIVKGYNVDLTQKSRDGGRDVILKDGYMDIGYVECKHFSEDNSVGIAVAHRLMGAMMDGGVDFGVLMTTGKVSSEAWKRSDKITIMNEDIIVKNVSQMDTEDYKKIIYNTRKRLVV